MTMLSIFQFDLSWIQLILFSIISISSLLLVTILLSSRATQRIIKGIGVATTSLVGIKTGVDLIDRALGNKGSSSSGNNGNNGDSGNNNNNGNNNGNKNGNNNGNNNGSNDSKSNEQNK